MQYITKLGLTLSLAGCMSHDPPRENPRDFATPVDPPTVVQKKVESTSAKKQQPQTDATPDTAKASEKGIARKEAVVQGDAETRATDTTLATAKPVKRPPRGYQLGRFRFTYYWVAEEASRKRARTRLYNTKCKRVASVTKKFAKRLIMEGTGRLLDGRMVNIGGPCKCPTSPCVVVLDEKHPWGAGSASRALSPFRSVAVDPRQVRIGRLLYIPELDGLTMPGAAPYGGFVHDGCVVADDQGSGVRGRKLDFFTALKDHYTAFNRRHRLQVVTVHDGKARCAKTRTNASGSRSATHRNSI